METALKTQLIRTLPTGILIQHPDLTSSAMVAIEAQGATYLGEHAICPLDLPMLAHTLAEWFTGWQSPIDGHSLGPEWAAETGYCYSATIRSPHDGSYIAITENRVRYWNAKSLFQPVSIADVARIVRGWYL